MIFKTHECGSTRITSENNSDKRLLRKLYDRIPKSQRGCEAGYWLFSKSGYGDITLSVTSQKALQNYIKKNLLVKR